MRRKLLSFALVLAMVVAIFAPTVSALAAADDSLTLVLVHDDAPRCLYGEHLWYGVYIVDADGDYIDIWGDEYEGYLNAPCDVTLLNSDGEAVWSNAGQYRLGYVWGGNTLALNEPDMKTWASGTYTMRVEVTLDGVTLSDAFDFYFEAWNGAEPTTISLEVSTYYFSRGVEIGTYARVLGANSVAVQACSVEFRLLDEKGKEVAVNGCKSDSWGYASSGLYLYDSENAYGTYTVVASVTDSAGKTISASKTVEFLVKYEPQVVTLLTPLKPAYDYGEEVELEFKVTDNDGNPARGVHIICQILNADGTALDEKVFWGTSGLGQTTDVDGIARFEWGFYSDNEPLPEGDYLLAINAAGLTKQFPFHFNGKSEPKTITVLDPRDTYYYGEHGDLMVQVIGENGKPVMHEYVTFEVLDAKGNPSDVGIFWGSSFARYDTNEEGITGVGIAFEDEAQVPEGEYIIRISAGNIVKDYAFSVELGEVQLTLNVYNDYGRYDRNAPIGYGDWLTLDARISYPGGLTDGIDEAFGYADLHWWIVNENGETVYESTSGYDYPEFYKNGWVYFRENYIRDIKDWESGTYTAVAEVTANSVTLHAEQSFEFIAWSGAGKAAQLTVELNKTTFNPNDRVEATVTLTDANGLPVQGEWVNGYLCYETGESAYIRWGYVNTFIGGYLGATGSRTCEAWFDGWDFEFSLPAGTYVLVFECDELTVEKKITFTGFEGAEPTKPHGVPNLTVTPDKTVYGPGDVMHLDFAFDGASAEDIAAYAALGYLSIRVDAYNHSFEVERNRDGTISFERFAELGIESCSCTFRISTYPSRYGWLTAEAEFNIYYSTDGSSPQKITVETPMEDVYYYRDYLDLWVVVTDESGNTVPHAKLDVTLLDKNKNPVNIAIFSGSTSVQTWTGYEGGTWAYWTFYNEDGEETLPNGEYFLKFSSGDAVLTVPFTYYGKVEPTTITAYENVRDAYYYGEDVYLRFQVTGEGGANVRYERVDFEILNANGTPSNVGIIWRDQTSSYTETNKNGIATVNLYFPGEQIPEGKYILRVSAGNVTKDFAFTVEKGELRLTLNVYSDMGNDEFIYGGRLNLWARIAYSGGWSSGIDEAFEEADLHWWIENSEGKVVFEQIASFYKSLNKYGWTEFTDDCIPAIKEWKDGEYTVVAEVTANSVTLRDEYSFYYIGWNGAGAPAHLIVDQSDITAHPGDYIGVHVSVTDENGIPVQGQYVEVYLRYMTGEPAFVMSGRERTLASGNLGGTGKGVLVLDFDWSYFFDGAIPSGTYILLFVTDDLETEKTITFVGPENSDATGPHEVPELTVTPDKSTYNMNDVINLAYRFDGASAETIAAYAALGYLNVYAFDSNGDEYELSYDEAGNISLAYLADYHAPAGTYTIYVSTYPEYYGWLAATASFTIQYTGVSEGEEEHSYGEPEFTWSADGKTATATFTCKNDGYTETVKATVTSKVKTAATCEKKGTTTYTATVTFGGKTYTATKDVEDIAALEHSYGAPKFTWSADGKTATATFTCANDAKHTEQVKATVTSKVKTAATCKTKGTTTYTATVTFGGKTYTDTKDVQDIPTLAHDYEKGVCKNCGEKDPNYKAPSTGLIGDINGDGKVNNIDYMMLKRYCLNTYKLTDKQMAVADINGDGKINSTDYMLLKRSCLGTYTIKQNH